MGEKPASLSIEKRYLLLRKELPLDPIKEIYPRCTSACEIFFVDVVKVATVLFENYELFKGAVGFDFDPLEIVLELQLDHSAFWDGIFSAEYSYLWGLLYGYGKENSLAHYWRSEMFREGGDEWKKKVASSIKTWRSSTDNRSLTARKAFSISNFPLPIFLSFSEEDPVVEQYKKERKKIKKLYRNKNFLNFTLDILTE